VNTESRAAQLLRIDDDDSMHRCGSRPQGQNLTLPLAAATLRRYRRRRAPSMHKPNPTRSTEVPNEDNAHCPLRGARLTPLVHTGLPSGA